MSSYTNNLGGFKKRVTVEVYVNGGVITDNCIILLPTEPWEWQKRPYKYTKNNARRVINMKREMAKVVMMIGD